MTNHVEEDDDLERHDDLEVEEEGEEEEDIHPHCLNCINLSACTRSEHHGAQDGKSCELVSCPNKCYARFHRCKLREHLAHTCPYEFVDCLNRVYGCQMKIMREKLTVHIRSCVASVVRCGSYRIRKLVNKNDKYKSLKWPDPIEEERLKAVPMTRQQLEQNPTLANNINRILLDQDYNSLRRFSEENPLKFHRMYGYLIGLNTSQDYSQSRFSFMQHLLKNVKSHVFPDIQTENCILFNDEDGCSACQSKIRKLESERFKLLKEDIVHFFYILKSVNEFRDFVEEKVYLREDFKRAYEEYYLKAAENANQLAVAENRQLIESAKLSDQDIKEFNDELLRNNAEILDLIQLNRTLQSNVTLEMPCEAFQQQYESYRIRDTNFLSDCDQILRRDEYSDHYCLYHDFLLPQSEQIDQMCPMHEYGCNYHMSRYDFIFGNHEANRYLDLDHPSAKLVHNELSNMLTFELDYLNGDNYDDDSLENVTFKDKKRSFQDHYYYSDRNNNTCEKNFLDLPFEVLCEIIDHLDSLSLYALSMTSKYLRDICVKFIRTRGICYVKWNKTKLNDQQIELAKATSKDGKLFVAKNKWSIEKLVYSFSKHVERPSKIKLKTNPKRNDFNMHVLNCPFKQVKEQTEKFRVFPHPQSKTPEL